MWCSASTRRPGVRHLTVPDPAFRWAGAMAHNYKRNGTPDLVAALNVQTREVICDIKARHSAKEVLGFFKLTQRSLRLGPPRRTGQSVGPQSTCGNRVAGSPQTRPLAPPLHPPSSSCLNLVEVWFKNSLSGGFAEEPSTAFLLSSRQSAGGLTTGTAIPSR